MTTPLAEVFRHNLWANTALFAFCAELTPGQLASSALGTYGAIYDTLRHIAIGEQWYVADIRGQSRRDPIARGEQPTVEALERHIQQSGADLVSIAESMSTDAYARWSDRGQDESMLAVRLAIQALDHAMEHRTHIRAILSQIGIQPPELDGWAFDAAQPDRGDYLTEGTRNG